MNNSRRDFIKKVGLGSAAIAAGSSILTNSNLLAASIPDSGNSNLRFNNNGKFKIVQFTDIHLIIEHEDKTAQAINVIETIIKKEKPDLVVLTGDVVTSDDEIKGWEIVSDPMIKAKTPWAAVFGNHDFEHGKTNKQMMDYIVTRPFNLSQHGPEEIPGVGNYTLEIFGASNKKTATILYFFDSHNYTADKKDEQLGTYDWIKFDQVKWYRETSAKLTGKNNDKPFPALAFFHIPLPEYNAVTSFPTTVGVKNEDVCCPNINSGVYDAFLECKDVMGVFTGHDHDNNYAGTLNDICLAYGCKTGFDSYGDLDKGARIIELYEGERKFDTRICTPDVPSKYAVSYPKSFEREKAK
jgi:predicted phosphodiesterase